MTFEQYDNENPQIWQAFIFYTMETIGKGFSNYSSRGVFEIIRWHSGVTGKGIFKVNNNFSADYAKKFMKEFPQHDGFFRIRQRS